MATDTCVNLHNVAAASAPPSTAGLCHLRRRHLLRRRLTERHRRTQHRRHGHLRRRQHLLCDAIARRFREYSDGMPGRSSHV